MTTGNESPKMGRIHSEHHGLLSHFELTSDTSICRESQEGKEDEQTSLKNKEKRFIQRKTSWAEKSVLIKIRQKKSEKGRLISLISLFEGKEREDRVKGLKQREDKE